MNKILRVVEIGATYIRRADVVNGEILNLEIHRTREILSGDILVKLQDFCQENWRDDIEALVVLVAGPVRDNKIVDSMPNFPEFPHDINLAESLNFNVPILVFNDMTAAVVGMAKLLKKQNITEPFWGLTWSTGLGGKFWDGEKIAIDAEIGHEIKINDIEAEKVLGGRRLTQKAGPQEVQLMGKFLLELNKIAPSNLYVFKGAIAKTLLADDKICDQIQSAFDKNIKIILSPEPDKDSFIGAAILLK